MFALPVFAREWWDSLDRLPPNMRYYEMTKDPTFHEAFAPLPDSNVRLVGKWGRGPSFRVTGRDSLVFLSLGSEVAIINMRNPANPRVITEVQASFVGANSVLMDSLLVIGGGGIEIWNIADVASPVLRSRIPLGVSDIRSKDSLLVALSGDSLRIYSLTDAGNPRPLGSSGDGGYYLSVSGGYAYVSSRWGLYVVDVRDPAYPSRVASWGTAIVSAVAADSLCYVTLFDPMNPGWVQFKILDVTDPGSIRERGHVDQAGGSDAYLIGMFAYASGYPPLARFQVIDVSNPDWPIVVSQCTTAGAEIGVWVNTPFGHAYVADHSEGLAVIDINDPVHPRADTVLLRAGYAQDIVVQSGLALIADYSAGMRLIDVSNPAVPNEVGAYDTIGIYPLFSAVAAKDSFAFVGEWDLRSVDISDPSHPRLAGTCPSYSAEDAVIRGNYFYAASDARFRIYDIANARAPRLVGICLLGDVASGIALHDSFAYVTGYPAMTIINVARPANPAVVDSFIAPLGAGALGIDVRDTLVFVASDSIFVVNVANPTSPTLVSTFRGLFRPDDIVLKGNRAYTTSYTAHQLVVFDITDPLHAVRVGQYSPVGIRRLFLDGGCIFAVCYDAGLYIFDTLPSSGLDQDAPPGITVRVPVGIWFEPNPADGAGTLHFSGLLPVLSAVSVHDASGRLVKSRLLSPAEHRDRLVPLNLSALPAGIYFVSLDGINNKRTTKVVKR